MKQCQQWFHGAIWTALVAVYVLVPLGHLADYAWDYDEGPQLQVAALADAGYPLYSEVVLNKPPLLTWWLQLAFTVGGPNLIAARFSILMVATAGFVALGVLAASWWGKWAGPLALLLYLLVPDSLVRAPVAMNDIPAMSAALLALLAATRYRHAWRLIWLVLAGIFYALALALHPLLLYMSPLLLLLLLFPTAGDSFDLVATLKPLLLFGLVILLGTFAWVLFVPWADFSFWVLDFNSAPLGPYLLEKTALNLTHIMAYLVTIWPFVFLALIGIVIIAFEKRLRLFLMIAIFWLALTFIGLYLMRPMWLHYPYYLIYPLVMLGGGGLAQGTRWLLNGGGGDINTAVPPRRLITLLTIAGWLSFALVIWVSARTPRAWSEWTIAERIVRDTLIEQTNPGDFIISDNQMLVFTAGRLVPPQLTDTSQKRISTGYLSLAAIVADFERYKPPFIVVDRKRFREIPGFMAWVEANASEQLYYGQYRMFRMNLPPS